MDLLLDSGDLALVAGRLQTVSGAAEVVQRIRLALGVQVGEWPLNVLFGVDWAGTVLVKPINLAQIDALLKTVISAVDGVARLLAYSSEVTSGRELAVAFTVLTTDGDEVALEATAPGSDGTAAFIVLMGGG